jgi:putative FmdB family regulatory protein
MPTYPYACTVCDHRFEVVQSFTDDALTVCPQCSGRLRKVFGSVGVVFKGSGFYRTDSRSASSSSTAASHNGSHNGTHAGSKDAKPTESGSAGKDGSSKTPATAGASGSSSSSSSSSSSTSSAA